MVSRLFAFPMLLLLACGGKGGTLPGLDPDGEDADNDGFPVSTDCDDANPSVNPGVGEVCDGIDNNCDGDVDLGTVTGGTSFYPDEDGDGFGELGAGTEACSQPEGMVAEAGDCDDSDATIHTGATEQCNGKDDDCDASIDESGAEGGTLWYEDADSDGHGSAPVQACEAPGGYVATGDDCDDADDRVYPGAPEEDCADPIDYNCDGSSAYADADEDGFAACEDCDDTLLTVFPGAEELCDGADNDCDSLTDDEDDDLDRSDLPIWYEDTDADGFGVDATSTVACDLGPTWSLTAGDCDDSRPTTAPGAAELESATACMSDTDLDGFGDQGPAAGVTAGTDCDDTDAAAYPGALDTCASSDLDCDGEAQEADSIDATTVYADLDGDTFGDAGRPLQSCLLPAGYAVENTDCDDTSAATFPGAAELESPTDCATDLDADGYGDASASGATTPGADCDDADPSENPAADEVCDGDDDDCDGDIDEDSAIDAPTWYTDADADGVGDPSTAVVACEGLATEVTLSGDCDDADGDTYPGAAEAESLTACATDADDDGYGESAVPSGVTAGADCDDADPSANPAGTEVCDGDDEDCDGLTDEPEAADATTWYTDLDNDAYGDTSTARVQCTSPGAGWIAVGEDCDDDAADVNPGMVEVCNDDTDNNCDGSADPCALSGSLSLSSADLTVQSSTATDALGWSVYGPGDVNGDALPDLLVGAPDNDLGGSAAGAVFLYLGTSRGTLSLSSATASILGDKANDNAGYALSGGDFDEDGYADIAVGAYQFDGGASNAGGLYIVHGPVSGTVDLASPTVALLGVSKDDDAASALATLPDLDGDGAVELLVGAPGYDDGPTKGVGAAYLLAAADLGAGSRSLSSASATLVGEDSSDGAGIATGGGDFNCDGVGDAIVGASKRDSGGTDRGTVYVLYGPFSGTVDLSTADLIYNGTANSDFLGVAVSSLGDFSGDDCDDWAAGATGFDSTVSGAGAAFFFFGGASVSGSGTASLLADGRVTGSAATDGLGNALTAAGDINGDGDLDLLVGAASATSSGLNDSGAAYLFYGPLSGTLSASAADATLSGPAASANAGRSVAGLGDVDDDGKSDLLIGGDDVTVGAATDAGTAWLYLGLGL